MSEKNATNVRKSRRDGTVALVTDTVNAELGADALNAEVTASTCLDVKVTKDGKTTTDGVKASLTVGVSHDESADEAGKAKK
jgi:hypothetical protein